MAEPRFDKPRGILRGGGAPGRFSLNRYHPSEALAELVDSYWITRWSLDRGVVHRQEVLPHPCVHVVAERGHSGVFGIETGKFAKVLEGKSRAFGIKFWPGAFLRQQASGLSSSGTPLGEVFGSAGEVYERAVLASDDDGELVRLAEAFIGKHCPPVDDDSRLARRIVEAMVANRDLARVEEVAGRYGLSVRSLQRLFERRVGVSPKWVLQRYRIHEALERLEAGEEVDFAALAMRLNYFDQAHFVRDFTKLVGRSPGKYVAALSNDGV